MQEAKLVPLRDDGGDLRVRLAETFGRDTPNPAVCVADGFGVRVSVDRGRLVVADGVGPHRRERRYAKATHALARLVIFASSGSVGLEALRWCAGTGVAVVVLDPFGGDVLLTSGGSANNDPRLRRSQGLAMGNETGLELARYLISAKLAGQASVVSSHLESPSAAATIMTLGEMVTEAQSLEEVRQLEAAAANSYFAAWSSLSVPFVRKDLPRVPEHWCVFEGRRSAVNVGTSRSATDPVNCLLNYSYRLLEAEGRLACLAIGLDPGLGVLHADVKGRDSLVLDVMEAVRPEADRFVLDLLDARPLLKTDFAEDRRGVLRVLPPLSHRIAEAMPRFASSLGPVVEHVAGLLAKANPYEPSVPSVLTRSKHRAVARAIAAGSGRSPVGPNLGGLAPRTKARQRPRRSSSTQLPLPICRGCGGVLPEQPDRDRPRRGWCDACLDGRRVEHAAWMRAAADDAAEEFREVAGVLPSHTEAAQERRRASNQRRQLARLAWEAGHGCESPDVEWYMANIAPKLGDLSLTEIAGALGVSTSSASKFRRGLRVPSPRHWEKLATLFDASGATVS